MYQFLRLDRHQSVRIDRSLHEFKLETGGGTCILITSQHSLVGILLSAAACTGEQARESILSAAACTVTSMQISAIDIGYIPKTQALKTHFG